MARKNTSEEVTDGKEGPSSRGPRQVLTVIGLLVLFAAVSWLLWSRWGGRILAARGGQLTAESITIPKLPKWIRTDVRAEVVRNAGLSRLSIHQSGITVHVGQAFRMHPWVASAQRASIRPPDGVVVDLIYRRPVAMVEIREPAGLFPVDSEGVFLPPFDFMPAANPVISISEYPRIRADNTYPSGAVGTPWGDLRVERAAALADFLGPRWKRLGLFEIVAIRGRREGVDPGLPTFELHSLKGTVVLWGHAPGDELVGEATADKKLAHLADFVQRHGSLDTVQSDQTIDVRHTDGLEVATIGRQLR